MQPTIGHDAVWVANTGANTVTVVDRDDFSVLATLNVPGGPQMVIPTAEEIWIATLDDGIYIYDPR